MEEPKKTKTITDDEGHEFTFDNTAEADETDIEVIDVTETDEVKSKNSGTVTEEEQQASFELD